MCGQLQWACSAPSRVWGAAARAKAAGAGKGRDGDCSRFLAHRQTWLHTPSWVSRTAQLFGSLGRTHPALPRVRTASDARAHDRSLLPPRGANRPVPDDEAGWLPICHVESQTQDRGLPLTGVHSSERRALQARASCLMGRGHSGRWLDAALTRSALTQHSGCPEAESLLLPRTPMIRHGARAFARSF